jgi:hypothetical protein
VLWTRQLDVQPAKQVREAIAELEELGWGSLWFWEVFGREAMTGGALLLGATQRMLIASGIANVWARDPVAMAAAGRTLVEAYPGRFVLASASATAPGRRPRPPLPGATKEDGRVPGRHGCGPLAGATAARGTAAGPGRPWPPHAGTGRGTIRWRLALQRNAGGDRHRAVGARRWAAAGGRAGGAAGGGPGRGAPDRSRILGPVPDPAQLHGAWDRAGLGPEEQAEGGSDRLVDAVVAWGGPQAITERVRAHLDAGADHVCVQVLDPDPNGLPMASWRALTLALLER